MVTVAHTTSTLVGSIRRFGRDGVLYEVMRQMTPTSALIRVLETGEEVVYPIASIVQDPTE
jgi:hypothetical protein